MKIYVASSWRNIYQPDAVAALRDAGHEVYDFRNPRPGEHGFAWSEIDPAWKDWTVPQYREALRHPIAGRGFASDYEAMMWADACVLVLPCGRSAHLEAGWFVGAGSPLHILAPEERTEPELMYKMANTVCVSTAELIEQIYREAHL